MSERGKRRRVHSEADHAGNTNAGNNPYLAHRPSDHMNPLTGKAYSARYRELLEGRRKLPIYQARAEVLGALEKHQVVVLEGETGSGKTTQVPQFLVESGYASEKLICCTQPRRVAAMSVATRVAEEMDVILGEQVGYSIRFEDKSSEETLLKYVTDGMLLREAMTDNSLSAYKAIVLDEAHERTLSTDILLGLLKEVLKRRPDLKVIVMSATLDASKFQDYFNGAPLLKVPGRLFPVEILYASTPEDDYLVAAVRTAIDIHRNEPPGDILIFLTGEDEIEDSVRKIQDGTRHLEPTSGGTIVLPLYSSLPPAKQQRVFRPPPPPQRPNYPPTRKIICATNVAETSLTIDGVVYVVDPGFSKQKIYNPRVRVESLLIQAISRASAKQRAGRAGRTKPGKCYRLYTEASFRDELAATAFPEILRSNLGNVVLQLKKLGIADLVHFDFMDPPAPETLMRALEQLNYLGALSDEGELTEFGSKMAEFPLDPELSAILINSEKFRSGADVLSVIAMLSAAPNWFVRVKKDKRCDEARRAFSHTEGDHLTLLNVFNAYKHRNSSERDDWCYHNYVNQRALFSANNVRTQLARIMRRLGIEVVQTDSEDSEYLNNIKRALLSGYFMHVAYKVGKGGQYITCKDQQAVMIHPSSGLRHFPLFVFYHEFTYTRKQYIRTCTSVRGRWLLEVAPHYFDLDNFPRGACKQELESVKRKLDRDRERNLAKTTSIHDPELDDITPVPPKRDTGRRSGRS